MKILVRFLATILSISIKLASFVAMVVGSLIFFLLFFWFLSFIRAGVIAIMPPYQFWHGLLIALMTLTTAVLGVFLSRERPILFGMIEVGFGVALSLIGYLSWPEGGDLAVIIALVSGIQVTIDGFNRILDHIETLR